MKTRLVIQFVVLTVAAVMLCATAVAVAGPAAHPGAPTGSSPLTVVPPGTGYTLTYDTFNSGTCSALGFNVLATAHANLETDVTIAAHTTLNGSPYDTYGFDLSAGTYTYPSQFPETFSPALSSDTYTFVFYLDVLSPGLKGTSVTTINCTNGTLSASNAFNSVGNVPTLGTWGIIVSILVLLAAGLIVLRARHTALG